MPGGEVAEWLKAAVSKIAILCTQYRGFESHPLRHLSYFCIFFSMQTRRS
jgi:hypothetical protein